MNPNTMQNLWYLIAAYGVIWALLFAYVFSVERRQHRLREELAALEGEMPAGRWQEAADDHEQSLEEVRLAAQS